MTLKHIVRAIVRLVVITVIEGVSLWLTTLIAPGITIIAADTEDGALISAISVAMVLAVLNGLLRPILILLTLPINMISLGLFSLVINALMLMLASNILPFFEVDSFWTALIGGLILSAVNTLITGFTTIDDDQAFYDGVVQWLSERRMEERGDDTSRGLVMLEIDGLSYLRMKEAIKSGLMPTAGLLIEQGGHALSHYDCGLPSQTSACQAGIMYGDNYDIPAFRWYDKEQGRLYVSNNFHDAAEINGRYANGNGLLREGTSINNLMSGDAKKAILTMSVLVDTPDEVDSRSPADMYLVFANPYFFSRALILTIWDILVELVQGARQRIRKVEPRINRMEKAYPILRGVTNVFMRDVSTYTVILDIIRGSPAIYTTYVGYDEVAHHAGPDTKDAMDTLRGIDVQLKRILEVIQRKAPRPYDVFLLSDHGQSYGRTFHQRYGITLSDYLETLVHRGAKVTEVNATENARGHAGALLAEIENMQGKHKVGRVTGVALNRAAKGLERRMEQEEEPALMDSEVIACVSGNLANVYFNLHAGKIGRGELEAAHPGLPDAVIAQDGIGLVLSYDDHDEPWVSGKGGARHLRSGQTVEQDPLRRYGDPDFRAEQLLRLAEFPHAGDLILISTLYPDGQVAAFEELVGNHGGLGGQQTDAFLFHPADMDVPPTSNATDVFYLLNARRGLTTEPLKPKELAASPAAWSLANLSAGVQDLTVLLARAGRVLRLDRAVFREVADDPLATGQALFIFVVLALASGVAGIFNPNQPGPPLLKFVAEVLSSLVGWSLMVFLALIAGRALKGQGNFTRSFRAIAFAQVPEVITWLKIIPRVGSLFEIVGTLMGLAAIWLALQEALLLSRWRALLIPIVALFVVAVTIVIVGLVSSGAALTVETILDQLGLVGQ
jgi:uncharacterized membrane protein YvlD (DUF360 family)